MTIDEYAARLSKIDTRYTWVVVGRERRHIQRSGGHLYLWCPRCGKAWSKDRYNTHTTVKELCSSDEQWFDPAQTALERWVIQQQSSEENVP